MLFGKPEKPFRFITFRRPLRALGIEHILSLWKGFQVAAW
jgi:hypothetical protein